MFAGFPVLLGQLTDVGELTNEKYIGMYCSFTLSQKIAALSCHVRYSLVWHFCI
jgi:hypothetical protein